jgi:uracil-DNA glycosylase
VLVGEQPGNEEDRAGHPFVGPAGRLLDEALETAGIDRKQTYGTGKAPDSRQAGACAVVAPKQTSMRRGGAEFDQGFEGRDKSARMKTFRPPAPY